jgi:CMP-N,N'-diacetyllegionaminic acid synthase
MKKEVTAIIVARKGSVRIKNKNLLQLGYDTLISRKIKQLKQVKEISRIVFGSNDENMLDHAKNHGVETVKRDDYYCDETICSANDMIYNMCKLVNTDIIVWAHCTNPLISPNTYSQAINTFLQFQDNYDSLLSVVPFKEHLWGSDKKPLNYNPYLPTHTSASNLPSYYMQDGGIFIQPHNQMLKNKYFFGNKPYLFTISVEEFLDINTMRDYLLAKSIIDNQ